MGSGWENQGPVRQVIITGQNGAFFVYNGTPTLGNLYVAISPTDGADPYGNPYYAGLTIYSAGNTGATFQLADLLGVLRGAIAVTTPTDVVSPYAVIIDSLTDMRLGAGDGSGNKDIILDCANLRWHNGPGNIHAPGNLIVDGSTTLGFPFRVGAYPAGGTSAYNFTFSRVTATGNNPALNLADMTLVQSRTDYNNEISTSGVFSYTAPVNGFYDASIYAPGIVSAARSTLSINNVNTNLGTLYASSDTASGAAGNVEASVAAQWLNAGQGFTFQAFQNSGANGTFNGRLNISRRLG